MIVFTLYLIGIYASSLQSCKPGYEYTFKENLIMAVGWPFWLLFFILLYVVVYIFSIYWDREMSRGFE